MAPVNQAQFSQSGAHRVRLPLAKLLWQSRRLLRQLGPAAVTGMACALLALLAQWHALQLQQQQQALIRQLHTAASAAAAPSPKVADSASNLAAFYAYLPAHAAIPDQLRQLVDIAESHGITLSKAEYKAEADSRADFLRYRITLPIRADYASTQDFLIHALQAMPTLTLESVAFKRTQIEAGEVEARIQLALLVRQERSR
jgi:hypothetical protein